MVSDMISISKHKLVNQRGNRLSLQLTTGWHHTGDSVWISVKWSYHRRCCHRERKISLKFVTLAIYSWSNPIYYIKRYSMQVTHVALRWVQVLCKKTPSNIHFIVFMTPVFVYRLLSWFNILTTYSSSWVKICCTVDVNISAVRAAYHESTKHRSFFFPV